MIINPRPSKIDKNYKIKTFNSFGFHKDIINNVNALI